MMQELKNYFNLFHVNGPFLYHLKTSENLSEKKGIERDRWHKTDLGFLS